MGNLIEKQEMLHILYKRIGSIKAISESIGDDDSLPEMLKQLEGPFLINVDNQYEESSPKIVFVGKENNGWMDVNSQEFYEQRGVKEALKEYETFDFENTYSCFLFKCLKNIREGVFGKDEITNRRRSVIYSNLFKFNQRNTPPMFQSIFKEIVLKIQDGIFQEEIRILQPDSIVFVTGPNYDKLIQRFYPDVQFLPVNGYPKNEMCLLRSRFLPKQSFRTFHPDYGMHYGKNRISRDYYELIID